jgi:uncharacterized protein (DUF1330 family)
MKNILLGICFSLLFGCGTVNEKQSYQDDKYFVVSLTIIDSTEAYKVYADSLLAGTSRWNGKVVGLWNVDSIWNQKIDKPDVLRVTQFDTKADFKKWRKSPGYQWLDKMKRKVGGVIMIEGPLNQAVSMPNSDLNWQLNLTYYDSEKAIVPIQFTDDFQEVYVIEPQGATGVHMPDRLSVGLGQDQTIVKEGSMINNIRMDLSH